jgi:copper chaperone
MATVKIKGMSCGHCVNAVTSALNGMDGIDNVNVDLIKGEATYDEVAPVPIEKIKEAISAIGFEVV